VNPNVGAALVVDVRTEAGVCNQNLEAFLNNQKLDYVRDGLPHQFFTLNRTFEEDLVTGIISSGIPQRGSHALILCSALKELILLRAG